MLALGTHRILMGPVSDLGPIDPQIQVGSSTLVSAKESLVAVPDWVDAVEGR